MPDGFPTLDEFVDRADALYSLPAVAVEVLELTRHPQVDSDALRACIENDPALVSKLLRVVNSSLFGLNSKVVDLNQALSLLGIKPLKLLVLGFSLPEQMLADIAQDVLQHYWRHALTKAVAARELAETVWHRNGDEVFLAGLLGNAGFLVLVRELGDSYVRFVQRVRDENGDQLGLECEALGFDHVALSAALLDRWKLPPGLIEAVATRGSVRELLVLPESTAATAQIMHLAELLAQVVAGNRIAALPDLLEASRAFRAIDREHIAELIGALTAKINALADVLLLDLPEVDYETLIRETHERMAALSEDVLPELLGSRQTPTEESLLGEVQALSSAAQQAAARPVTESATATAPATDPAAAAHAARQAPAVADRATTLAADPGLVGRLQAALRAARHTRQELSLLVFEPVDLESIVMAAGPQVTGHVRAILERAGRRFDHPHTIAWVTGDATLAIIAPDCDRRLAIDLGYAFARGLESHLDESLPAAVGSVAVAVGVASVVAVAKNLPDERLLDCAARCLFASRLQGGTAVKSIEV